MDMEVLYSKYNVQPLSLQYREHMCAALCTGRGPSQRQNELDCDRLAINLRSNNKVNFKKAKKQLYELYLKSSKVRGLRIWEMLPANMKKATTKVKFKRLVKAICKT